MGSAEREVGIVNLQFAIIPNPYSPTSKANCKRDEAKESRESEKRRIERKVKDSSVFKLRIFL